MSSRSTRAKKRTGLFFDGSGVIGWALMDFMRADPVIQFSHFEVPTLADPEAYGARWSFVMNSVDRLIKLFEPAMVGFEAPFIPPQKSEEQLARERARGFKGRNVSITMLRFLIGVDAMIETAASRYGLECRECSPQTAKKALTGSGRADKIEMKNAARARGWNVKNDHESDAIAVGLALIADWKRRNGIADTTADRADRARDRRLDRAGTPIDDTPPHGWKVFGQ